MKYSQKQTRPGGLLVSEPRGQTAELKQTVNRQCSYALAEFQSIRRESHSLRLTSITTSQEIILKTHLGPVTEMGHRAWKNFYRPKPLKQNEKGQKGY